MLLNYVDALADGDITSTDITVGNGVNATFEDVTLTIADGAIVGGAGGKIADNTITASDLAPNSVDSSEITSDAVGSSELQDDAVTSVEILNATILTEDIAPSTTNNQVLTTDNTGAVVWANPSATETTTNLSQDTSTGVITYVNETTTSQTANIVGAEATNSISVGANGGAFYESPIKAFGKIGADGTEIKVTTNVTVDQLGTGRYRVNLPAALGLDGDYIIQLSQPGRGGAGNDDPGISYSNQNPTFFDVLIGDNDNGGGDRATFNSEFMFTVLSF